MIARRTVLPAATGWVVGTKTWSRCTYDRNALTNSSTEEHRDTRLIT
ncbi:MAG: hypothetical protein H6708_02480 [Kofleriaceae bacterium]|nr:hypothetical protein [Kofleriaceae bacterium]